MRVLVVDDDQGVAEAVGTALELDGYEVAWAADGHAGLDEALDWQPDAMILDVLMPVLDGLSVCRRLRATGDRVPILMLTARDAVADRIDGLDAGADDYLVKPFDVDELLARLRALLRRAYPATPDELRLADLVVDVKARRGRRGERVIDFTRTEFTLLELLMTNAGQVLTRELIVDRVWGYDLDPSTNALEVYIGYLRRKLGEPKLVHTVRGVGYVMRDA
ncbi:response regulator transcription factor [Streptosporangium sp. CA-135522]|uniref:response regulator transcription factor n=1 Tax=Streptosporangium sp. CA-135522 TaxID=3240072 RepID=UPI003D916D9A